MPMTRITTTDSAPGVGCLHAGGMDSLSFRPVTPADIDELVPLIVRADELTADWAPAGWSLPADHSEREFGTWREELASDDFRAELAHSVEGVILGVVATK